MDVNQELKILYNLKTKTGWGGVEVKGQGGGGGRGGEGRRSRVGGFEPRIEDIVQYKNGGPGDPEGVGEGVWVGKGRC